MPQWRKLWVKSTESLDINDMPDDFHRLLWLMLPLIACREGRGIDNAAWIKAKSMPLRVDVYQEQVEAAMCWYAERRMLTRYEVAGRRYYQLHNWVKHQGDTKKEAASNYPGMESNGAHEVVPSDVETNAGLTPDLLRTNSSTDSDSDADADSEKNKPSVADATRAPSEYPKIAARWAELFPDRPHPTERNKALRAKTATRMKDGNFPGRWEAALVRMTNADSWVLEKSWFTLNWFLANDENWRKCADGNYDDKSKRITPARPHKKDIINIVLADGTTEQREVIT